MHITGKKIENSEVKCVWLIARLLKIARCSSIPYLRFEFKCSRLKIAEEVRIEACPLIGGVLKLFEHRKYHLRCEQTDPAGTVTGIYIPDYVYRVPPQIDADVFIILRGMPISLVKHFQSVMSCVYAAHN